MVVGVASEDRSICESRRRNFHNNARSERQLIIISAYSRVQFSVNRRSGEKSVWNTGGRCSDWGECGPSRGTTLFVVLVLANLGI